MWKFGPRPTPCHPDLFRPRYQDWVPTIKDPIETQPRTFFEPWPVKEGSSFFPPKQRTVKSPQGRANGMLKLDFPKKGMGKEK